MLAKGDSGATALFRAYLGLGNNVVERGKREDRRGVGAYSVAGLRRLARVLG